MAAAFLLTVLATGGAAAGLFLGERHRVSLYLEAAGGGLLLGIALFWILPEIASELNWLVAPFLMLAACFGIAQIDHYFKSTGSSPRREVIGPLLTAAAIHSFLDGWSLRAVWSQQAASLAVPLGLALHKVPEGLALGWVTGHAFVSRWKALGLCAFVEAITVMGAWAEPRIDQSAVKEFGPWWMAVVLAIIAGSFSFLGIHAVLPARRKAGVVAIFFATLLSVAGATLIRG
jgi:zinc and cadmium transporter